MRKVYINPQWQGGADLVTYEGAKELLKYLTGQDTVILPVSTNETEMAVKKKGIKGFDALRRQMNSAYDRIQADAPDKIFTLGGGCDADVPAIVYLSKKYQGDLTLIWMDAHGDLNTPNESESSLFYGMPLRSVTDRKCFGLLENQWPISTSQIIHIGGRDFDDAEKAFINETGMAAYSVQDFHSACDLMHRLAKEIRSDHVYVHLDLDVIDPAVFPNTPLPVTGGLSTEEVLDILDTVTHKQVGFGICEYAPCGRANPFIEKLIQLGTAL